MINELQISPSNLSTLLQELNNAYGTDLTADSILEQARRGAFGEGSIFTQRQGTQGLGFDLMPDLGQGMSGGINLNASEILNKK